MVLNLTIRFLHSGMTKIIAGTSINTKITPAPGRSIVLG